MKYLTGALGLAAALALCASAQALARPMPPGLLRLLAEAPPPPLPIESPIPWPHPKRKDDWRTCIAQATRHVWIYQDDNDLFVGNEGPSCIGANRQGTAITIERNYAPGGYGVVAYPAVRVGMYPYNRDPLSGLPAPVTRIRMVLHLRNTGNAGGLWIDDMDAWFGRPNAPLDHIREMIAITRWRGYTLGSLGHAIKVGNRYWYVNEWKTGHPGHMWPLIRFIARRPTSAATIDMAVLIRAAMHHRWLSRNMVLASVSDGSECWSGCRGLTDKMVVRHLP